MQIMKLVEQKRLLVNLKTNKNKKLEDEIEKLTLQLANLGVKNNEVSDKK